MGSLQSLKAILNEQNNGNGPIPEVQLTEDQQKAVDFINQHKTGIIVLNGSAGTGKTTAIKGKAMSWETQLSAPTHQAAKILRDKTGKNAETIQSILGVRPNKEKMNRDGIEVFEQVKSYRPDYHPVLIIDEASMIGISILGYIEEYQALMEKRHGQCLVVFVGDNKQLPPVNEERSPIFHRDYPTFTLTKILRQAEANDNIKLSMNLGWLDEYKDGEFFKWHQEVDYKMLADANGTNKCKFLTWTNARVAEVNDTVRSLIYGKNVREYEVGETLRIIDSEVFPTNEEIVVRHVVADHIQLLGDRVDVFVINSLIIHKLP